MGDANSWLIFLIGLFAVVLLGIALLVALLAGLALLLKYLFARNGRRKARTGRPDELASESFSTEHAAYNVASDIVLGLNARKSDNRFQAISILVSVLLSAGVGAVAALLNGEVPWIGGAIASGIAGLVVGFLASGILVMVYRGVRHIQGKHD